MKRKLVPSAIGAIAVALTLPVLTASGAPAPPPAPVDLDVVHWSVIRRESGPVNYYQVATEPGATFVRAHYRPPAETTVLGIEVRGHDRSSAQSVRWRWRAQILPVGGDECAGGRQDSAAVVYLTWKRGLKWYTLKYVWSGVGRLGAVCDRKRNLFVAQDTTILETGGPTGVWKEEFIDLKSEFRRHFEGGNQNAGVPDFIGIGIMTDGDQTHSESAADYADFVMVR
jgi:hypothetical protein